MVRAAHGDAYIGWQLPAGEPVVTNHGGDWFRVRREGFGYTLQTERSAFDADVRLGMAGTRPVVTGLVLLAEGGNEITSTDLKALSLPSIIESLFRGVEDVVDLPKIAERPRGPGAPTITEHQLRNFAKTYRVAAKAHPRAPTRRTAELTGMSEPSVRRWRARAEDAGYLAEGD